MTSDFYNFESDNNALLFTFQSISESKIIDKVIVYSSLPDNPEIFNLALGDKLEGGEISDVTISNNSDLEKVIATVVQTMLRFFEKYPSCYIFFKGSSPSRTRLYRIIINREFDEVSEVFEIYGIVNDQIEPFKLNCSYDSFVISMKNLLDPQDYENN